MDQNDNNFINPMTQHYADPTQNAFLQDGLTIDCVKEKNPRVFLTYPQGLKKNAIHNIMKQFGHVVSIDIPYNNLTVKKSRIFAFVEYSTFKEAEKAIREINSSKKDGQIDIRAEFARAKNEPDLLDSHSENVPQMSLPVSNNEIAEEIPQAKISVNLNYSKLSDSTEKVSQFEFKGPIAADPNDPEIIYLKKCAEKSLGEYNEEEDFFEYNILLKENNFLTFYCNVCDKEAVFEGEAHRYFCSKECFDTLIIKNSEKSDEPQNKNYSIQQSDKVFITAIINEKSIYVRPCNEDLDFLLETINRKAKNCQNVSELPAINDQVIVCLFDNFYRAVVIEDDNEEYSNNSMMVRLIDIGNTVRVNFEDLYEMNEECMNMKKITTNITLKDVNVEAINMNVIEYLTSLMYNNTELIIMDIDENGVQLKDNSTNCSVNQKIVKLSNFEHVSFDDLEYGQVLTDLIPIGENKRLYVVNAGILKTIGGICCISEKYIKDFHEFYRSINAYGKTIDPESYGICGNKPLCIVKYSNQWHRAIVNKAEGDGKPECVLVDLQFICKIKVENIFKIPQVLAKFPYLTEIYKIDGYDTNEEIKKFCDENINDNEFIYAKKIEVKDDIPIIHFI